jgi:hypothetical protein
MLTKCLPPVVPEIVVDFLNALSAIGRQNHSHCPDCGAALAYRKGVFFLSASTKGWIAPIPVCPNCDRVMGSKAAA